MADTLLSFQVASAPYRSKAIRRLAGSLSVTLVGQALMLCGLFLVTRLSVRAFGPEGFGQFQVARRTLAVVAFPLMCGLGISLPRNIARNINQPGEVTRWFVSSLLLAAALITSLLGLGLLMRQQLGGWTFGDARSSLVWPLLVSAAGMFFSTLASAAMRGLSRFRDAAILQVVNGALVPLFAVLTASGRVDRALSLTGVLWTLITLAVLFRLGRTWDYSRLNRSALASAIRELITFGAPRVPGDIALFGLFAFPAYASVHRNDILGAGFLSVGLSLVQAIATAFASAGFVLLPYWSRAAASAESRVIARKKTVKLLITSIGVSTCCLGLLQLFLPAVARLLLGPLAPAGLHQIRYVMLSAVPYVLYLVLRDYFDALTAFPLNTIALGIAILAQIAFLNLHWFSVPTGTAASFFVLGASMLALWAIPLRCFKTGL
jgi:O-antigen/teichoic acid export membrane protein